MMEDMAEKSTLILLAVIGVAQMIRHPRKSYNLIVHKVGWYD
jgi:hypothetical protein